MSTYIYIYIYIYMYGYIRVVCPHIYIYIYIYTFICIHTYTLNLDPRYPKINSKGCSERLHGILTPAKNSNSYIETLVATI